MSDFTVWYVDTRGDPDTNKLVAKMLPVESACSDKLCADGLKRNLLMCEHSMVAYLENARVSFHLKHQIFVQRYPHGKVRLWRFNGKRVKTAPSVELHVVHHE